MNSVGWAGRLLKTPTAKSRRFWIGTSAQWDRASFVEGFEGMARRGQAFQGCLHDYILFRSISIYFGFQVAAILPLENGWRVFFVLWKKAKFNFPTAARLCSAESLPHRAANAFKASRVESHRLQNIQEWYRWYRWYRYYIIYNILSNLRFIYPTVSNIIRPSLVLVNP